MTKRAKLWIRVAFIVLAMWTLFCAAPYISSIMTPSDRRYMEQKRAAQILQAIRTANSEGASMTNQSFPACVHKHLFPTDYALFDFAKIPEISRAPSNTVLLTSKDHYLTLHLDGDLDLRK